MSDQQAIVPVNANRDVEDMDFDQYMAWLKSQSTAPVPYTEEGKWELTDKEVLVGVPFVIARVRFNPGEYGRDFVSVCAFLKDGKKIVFNDGGTGIPSQLKQFIDDNGGRDTGIFCEKGLRVSRYKWVDPSDNLEKPAVTFYIG